MYFNANFLCGSNFKAICDINIHQILNLHFRKLLYGLNIHLSFCILVLISTVNLAPTIIKFDFSYINLNLKLVDYINLNLKYLNKFYRNFFIYETLSWPNFAMIYLEFNDKTLSHFEISRRFWGLKKILILMRSSWGKALLFLSFSSRNFS